MSGRSYRGGDGQARAYDQNKWDERAAAIRSRLSIEKVVEKFTKLDKAGSNAMQGLCPMPDHLEKTGSFTIYPKGSHKIRVPFFVCYGCGAKGDVIHFVMKRQGLGWIDAIKLLESENGLALLESSAPAPRPTKVLQADDKRKMDRDARLWENALPLGAGGMVDSYLRQRAIVSPAEYGFGSPKINGGWPADLRFVERCYHYLEKREYPAMVAAIRGPGGELLTVHRTFLARQADGTVTKAAVGKAKLVGGSWAPGFIRLGADADAMLGGEGIETTLSAMQLYKRPGICFVNSGRMKTVEPPFACSDFIYAADKGGKGKQGERFASEAAAEFGRTRKTWVRVPKIPVEKGDFNDFVRWKAGLLVLEAPKPEAPAERRSDLIAATPAQPSEAARRVAALDEARAETAQSALELKRIERAAWKEFCDAGARLDALPAGDSIGRARAQNALAIAEGTWKAACRAYEAAAKRRVA